MSPFGLIGNVSNGWGAVAAVQANDASMRTAER